jgi:hypothetical protein
MTKDLRKLRRQKERNKNLFGFMVSEASVHEIVTWT